MGLADLALQMLKDPRGLPGKFLRYFESFGKFAPIPHKDIHYINKRSTFLMRFSAETFFVLKSVFKVNVSL